MTELNISDNISISRQILRKKGGFLLFNPRGAWLMDSGLLTKVFKVTARPFATTNPKGVEGKSALYRESDDLGTMSKKGRVFKGPDPKR